MNFAVIDIETTGLSPKKEKITEVAIYIHDGKEIIDHYSTLINPECSIPYEITMLTGIKNEMVINAPKFYEVAKKIQEITKNCIFVAHNANFDYGFIKTEFKALGFDYKRDKLCTARFARKHLRSLKSFSLKNLCNHFKIDLDGHHRADADAGATVKLLEHLLRIKDEEDEPDEDTHINLPPYISQEFVDSIPNTPGVY
jgi:DNA polymerase-3 subunit epsilon